MNNHPRIVIAAPRSGSGKTLITTGLMKALKDRGYKVNGFKCGPDYIDPAFHRKILGIPSGNLDLFFSGEEQIRDLFVRGSTGDISVIEGVMGLYDGVSPAGDTGSTYHLARVLKAPVILVIDAKGMGRSVMAEIAGFLSMDSDGLIAGVILNRMSESYFETIRPVLEERFKVPMLGCFPVHKELNIQSRHLGLVMPDETQGVVEMAEKAARFLEESADLDALIGIARNAPALRETEGEDAPEKKAAAGRASENGTKDRKEDAGEVFIGGAAAGAGSAGEEEKPGEGLTVAVAKDEAFCFCYQENLDLLEKYGCRLSFFSPIHDERLPKDADGFILYGGYPELHAGELAANVSMLESIREAIRNKVPSLAECGGFMYLNKTIEDKDGNIYPMVGAVDGNIAWAGKLTRFGYIELEPARGAKGCPELLRSIKGMKAHEFHYYDGSSNGEDCVAKKPSGGRQWPCIHAGSDHVWGFPHLYYESDPAFIRAFISVMREAGPRRYSRTENAYK